MRKHRTRTVIMTLLCCLAVLVFATSVQGAKAKPSPDQILEMLQLGNARFVGGRSIHPNTTAARLAQAGTENQGDYAYATVITCSDSRVPVERLFDAGVMDIFVIRVAGNVCDTDEVGSIEYGLAHVKTPVLVVLGHKQCGAVTAVTHAVQGVGHALERNIPPLVDNIEPAVRRAMKKYPSVHGDAIIPYGIEENVWQGIEDLYIRSPSTRELVKSGKVKVVGAIYDVGTGKVDWLPESKSVAILAKVESDPSRAMNAMADAHGDEHASADHGSDDSSAYEEYETAIKAAKKNPHKAIEFLKEGNERFVSGNAIRPHQDAARLHQAGTENQGDHAIATVITCSDSRVPVEQLFDVGIMDTFIIRIAGNVCDTDEVGSIEYGLSHVNTPVLVVLGHKQCGAVTAVTHAVHGTGHALERNIPPLVDNIQPAVEKAIASHRDVHGDDIIPYAIVENVYQGIEDLFMTSPSTRNLVNSGKVAVVGAIYDVGTGRVEWLPERKSAQILAKVENNPGRAMNAMAATDHGGGAAPSDDSAPSHGAATASGGAGHGATEASHGAAAEASHGAAAEASHGAAAEASHGVAAEASHGGAAHTATAVNAEKITLIDPSRLNQLDRARHRKVEVSIASLGSSGGGINVLWKIVIALVVIGIIGAVVWQSGFFSRLGIAGKLYGGFATVVVLAVATGLGGYYFLSRTSTEAQLEVATLELDMMADEIATFQNEFVLYGIEDKQRGDECIKGIEALFEEYKQDLTALNGFDLDEVDRQALATLEQAVHKYEKVFAELTAKFHEVEEYKEKLDELSEQVDTQIAGVLRQHISELLEMEQSGADASAIAIQTELIEKLAECELLAVKISHEEVEFLLDKRIDRVAGMEHEFGLLYGTLAAVKTLIPRRR